MKRNRTHLKRRKPRSGFTLIESILAIGILAVVAVQILNVQSSSIQVTNTSRNHMYATWALKSVLAQLRYVKDTIGMKALPKDVEQTWSANPDFKFKIEVKENPIEAARLFKAILGAGGKDDDDKDSEGDNKQLAEIFNQVLPKDMYNTVKISVLWTEGEFKKSFDSGLMTIDSSMVKLPEIPNFGGLGGGSGGGKESNGQGNDGAENGGSKTPATPAGNQGGTISE